MTGHRLQSLASVALATSLLAGCAGGGSLGTTPTVAHGASGFARPLKAPLGLTSIVANPSGATRSLCPKSTDATQASCFATVRMASSSSGAAPQSVSGLKPNDLSSIYNYPAPNQQGATNQTVGIVVAYDAPNAESDLAVYRSYFGLPPCTTANGCFTKVHVASAASQSGTSAPPSSISPHPTTSNGGWADETDTDLETVSAVCPNCSIVLAEADSNNLSDLAVAVSAAVQEGATVVNASFGAPEDSSQSNLESYFEPSPVKVVAAAGDSGPGASFPASARKVIAVAGTTVNVSGSQVSESLWSGSGGGCSRVFGKLRAQPYLCSNGMRDVADVAAVADPNTGVAFYDSSLGGWGIVGGTSVSAPIVAGLLALAGNASSGYGASLLYQNSDAFAPVQNGGNIAGVGAPNGLAGL